MSDELKYVKTLTIDVFYDGVGHGLVWRLDGQWYAPSLISLSARDRVEAAFRDREGVGDE